MFPVLVSVPTDLWNVHSQHVLADTVEAFHVLVLVPGGLGDDVLRENQEMSSPVVLI